MNKIKDDGLSRRAAVSKGVGYALAVSPITAFAASTSVAGLDASDVLIPTGSGGKEAMPAYVARPQGTAPHSCVIVIQEIFGLHEYIRDVCRRLAHAGYLAVAPSLYFRQGDATKISDIQEILKTIVSKVPQAQVLGDLDALVAWLGKDPRAKVDNLGITGFCWGGTMTWLYAAHNPKVKAGVAWYGRLMSEVTPNQPRWPLDIAASLTVPVLGLYGEKDHGIPLSDVEKMRAALQKGKTPSKIIIYNGADHGFHADYRPTFNAQAAAAGWQEMLGWFKAHGV